MIRTFFTLTLICTCVFGCAQRQPGSSSTAAAVSSADKDLIQAIYQRLESDPVTAGLDLVVQSDDGIATIYGRIDNSAAHLRAVSVVRSTAGVRGVIDKTFKY